MLYYVSPDYHDPWEWRMAQNLAWGLSRTNTLEGFIGLLLAGGVLFLLILFKLLLLALRRLWDTYQARATTTTRSGQVLRWSGIGLLVLWVLALLLATAFSLHGAALLLFATSLFVFTLISEIVDYYQRRTEEATAPVLPENVSLNDVITWKNETDAATVAVPVG